MKVVTLACLVALVLLVWASPASAQVTSYRDGPQTSALSGRGVAAGLGMGLTIIGAGWGLGRIGAAAVDAMARQPEVAAQIQTGMIIVAAMLEGATLASVVLSFVVGAGANW
jgi:F-type H+-transporting ATPase subunit c